MILWLLTLAVLSAPAVLSAAPGGSAEDPSGEQPESTLVQLNITIETKGASETVEINGRPIPDYRPTIIQVFPSTGVVIDEKGHVLTFLGYRWVDIQSPNPRIEIITTEGKKYQGKLVGIDQSLGVAVVRALEAKLKKTPLCLSCEVHDGTTIMSPVADGEHLQEFRSSQVISMGSSATVAQQGSWVMTVGRPIPGVGQPILNAAHLVLGFVANQQPSVEDPMGMSAIVYPISQLMNSAEKILSTNGDIRTGWLGVYLVDSRPTSEKGVVIKDVAEGSPAQKAGLLARDTLLKWNGALIRDARQFIQTVQNTAIGSKVLLDVLREGKPLTLSALVEARQPTDGPGKFVFNFPDSITIQGSSLISGAESEIPRIGVETVQLTPELADFLKMPGQSGLLVLKVEGRQAAARAGVQVGDVIVSVDGETVLDPRVFALHIQSRGWGGRLNLKLFRKGSERPLVVTLPKSPDR